MTVSMEMQVRISELRQKAQAGTLTDNELKEAITFLRSERVAAAPAKQSVRKQAAAIDGNALLKELGLPGL